MRKAIWDKSLIKVYMSPMTGQIADAVDDPNWLPPGDVVGMVYSSPSDLKAHFPGVDFEILGKRLEHNNTRTTEQAFGFKVEDAEIENQLVKGTIDRPHNHQNGSGTTKKEQPMATLGEQQELLMAFTRAALDAMKSSGARETAVKKAFCNGLGRAIIIMHPEMQERLKRIVHESRDMDLMEADDTFI